MGGSACFALTSTTVFVPAGHFATLGGHSTGCSDIHHMEEQHLCATAACSAIQDECTIDFTVLVAAGASFCMDAELL